MSTQPQPIAGNESFKNVNTLAGQIPHLDAAEITAFQTDSVILGGGSPLDPNAPAGEDNHLVILSGNPIFMGDCCSNDTTSQITIEQGTALSGFPGADVKIGSGQTNATDTTSSKVEIRGVEVRVQTNTGGATPGKLSFFDASPVVQPAAIPLAVDPASAVTAVNAVIQQLQVLGLISV